MPVYMTQFSYTTEAWKALCENPVDRRDALRSLTQALGGRLIELYYAFGDYDGLVLLEAPDDATAAAGVLAALGSGSFKTMKTTKLLTVNEIQQALRMAGPMAYRGPGSTA